MKINSSYLGLYLFSAIIYMIAPFWGMLLSLFIIGTYPLSNKGVLWFSFLIAMFWGLLAYTQNCKYLVTDSIRYYEMFSGIINQVNSFQDLVILLREELLTFIFIPLTTAIVYLTKNVQIISLFWVTISYYFFFISVLRILKHEKIYNQKIYVKYLIVMIFCVMLFVQISETIKNAAAFSIAFYGLTHYYTTNNLRKSVLWMIVAIGIHPSTFIFLILFFYKTFKTNYLLLITFLFFPIAIKVNIFGLLGGGLTGMDGYLGAMSDLASSYASSEGTSTRYLIISFSTFLFTFFLYRNDKYNNNSSLYNMILLYFLISSLNASNIHSYVRFVNFIHPFVFLAFVANQKNKNKYSNVFVFVYGLFFAFFTIRLTFARMFGGEYLSTYMGNSFIDIMFSNILTYLSYPVFSL